MKPNRAGYTKMPAMFGKAIEWLNDSNPDFLRFSDFRKLKSGVDRFSKMRLADLVELADPKVAEVCAILMPDTDEKLVAVACRWAARGLKPELAVRKLCTDGSVANAAIRKAVEKRTRPRSEVYF